MRYTKRESIKLMRVRRRYFKTSVWGVRNIFLLAVMFLFTLPATMLLAQDEGFAHKLKWEVEQGAAKYMVEIQQEDVTISATETKNTNMRIQLPPGRYQYRVTVYDIFNKPAASTKWIPFIIELPKRLKPKSDVIVLIRYNFAMMLFPEEGMTFDYSDGAEYSFAGAGAEIQYDFGHFHYPDIPIVKWLGFNFYINFNLYGFEDPSIENTNVANLSGGLGAYFRFPLTESLSIRTGLGLGITFSDYALFSDLMGTNSAGDWVSFTPMTVVEFSWLIKKTYSISLATEMSYMIFSEKESAFQWRISPAFGIKF